jgi:glycosyltransferase involved in cell wall biosynthesis
MKISVCIPVYNFDVRELVFSLSKEIENQKLNAEIILIDDASNKDFVTIINEPLKKCKSIYFPRKKYRAFFH